MSRLHATYLVETPLPLAEAAAALAAEQSSGTFVAVPGESESLKQRFAARVEKITELESSAGPALPFGRGSAATSYRRAEITVSWPVENFGGNLPTLVSTVQGNLYELAQFSGLKLLDLELPASFTAHFRGPQFGVAGSRALTGVNGRPLIGTIVKPSIGLSPEQTADLVRVLLAAGIDFIKDDELMANPAHSPFDARVDAIMPVITAHAERTGRKAMFAFNISDEPDAMARHYAKVVAAGGTCAMVSLNSVGLAATKKICDFGALVIHGHRNGWGMLNRHPLLGIEFPAYQKLWRLAGVDQLHVNGIANKFWESDDSVVRSIASCLAPEPLGQPLLPVVSSGQWGGQAPETWRRTRTIDLLYLAGGGILAHPDGPAAGVRSLRQWWEAAVEGHTVETAVAKYPELAVSVKKFGRGKSAPRPPAETGLRLAYYGDDFTGSTDALEFLSRAGLPTVLFTAPPTAAQLARFPGVCAIGVAGLTRSLAPADAEAELRPAFTALRALGAPHVHYKVCSTFDSSPTVGSIGRAIDVGADVFRARFVPLVVGAPALGRHCVFGNLFARLGIGSGGAIHRLDRHPAMRQHPVTPADESDLRLHLARQTKKRIGLFDILSLALPENEARAAFEALLESRPEIVLFDVLDQAQLGRIGALIDAHASRENPLFSVGSSGIEMALGAHWSACDALPPRRDWPAIGTAKPLLVVLGSCSPVTAAQIAWAEAHGFAVVPFEPAAGTAASAALAAGRHTIICSSRGAAGPALLPASLLGTDLGRLARDLIAQHRVRRLVVAGGDTSGYAARALGIEALEMLAPLAPGAPLCRVHAPGSPVDGLEINFKGGQVGGEDYFGAAARGGM